MLIFNKLLTCELDVEKYIHVCKNELVVVTTTDPGDKLSSLNTYYTNPRGPATTSPLCPTHFVSVFEARDKLKRNKNLNIYLSLKNTRSSLYSNKSNILYPYYHMKHVVYKIPYQLRNEGEEEDVDCGSRRGEISRGEEKRYNTRKSLPILLDN